MSRDIKFRAWNPLDKRMMTMTELWDCNLGDSFLHHPDTYPYSFMQYTGLKDKNGKDIYEGDIVKLGDFKYIVFYQAPSFIMKVSNKHKTWHTFSMGYMENQFEEVIGNIYENKELLK